MLELRDNSALNHLSSLLLLSLFLFQPLAAFNVGLGAPSCGTFGTACTSGDLLKKRGSIGGGELNQPSSIDTCTDGSDGIYRTDESMEAITIADKNGGIMTTGSTVVISADVLAYTYDDGKTLQYLNLASLGSSFFFILGFSLVSYYSLRRLVR